MRSVQLVGELVERLDPDERRALALGALAAVVEPDQPRRLGPRRPALRVALDGIFAHDDAFDDGAAEPEGSRGHLGAPATGCPLRAVVSHPALPVVPNRSAAAPGGQIRRKRRPFVSSSPRAAGAAWCAGCACGACGVDRRFAHAKPRVRPRSERAGSQPSTSIIAFSLPLPWFRSVHAAAPSAASGPQGLSRFLVFGAVGPCRVPVGVPVPGLPAVASVDCAHRPASRSRACP